MKIILRIDVPATNRVSFVKHILFFISHSLVRAKNIHECEFNLKKKNRKRL